MKIALIGHVFPFGVNAVYGAERQIWYLSQALAGLGHEVTIFAGKGCELPGIKYVPLERPFHDHVDLAYQAITAEESSFGPFDMVQSYQPNGFVDPRLRARPYCLDLFHVFFGWDENLVAVSHLMNHMNNGRCTVIYYGIPEEPYGEPVPHDNYLVWIGRMQPDKAPHLAIEVAKRSGKRIFLMGHPHDYSYFVSHVWPHIDGDKVIWLRGVDDEVKRSVFRKAEAFISTNASGHREFFGVVNIESLASGVPVIGWANRHLPSAINFSGGEIITHGTHGFVVEYESWSDQDMEAAVEHSAGRVKEVGSIDRLNCWRRFKEKFTARVMAENHVKYYEIVRRRGTVRNVTDELYDCDATRSKVVRPKGPLMLL